MAFSYQEINSSNSSSNLNIDNDYKKKILLTTLIFVIELVILNFLVNSIYNTIQYTSRLYLLLNNNCVESLLGDWCSTFIDVGFGIITLISENKISIEYEYNNIVKSCDLNNYIKNLQVGDTIPIYLIYDKDNVCEHEYYVSEFYDENFDNKYNEYTFNLSNSILMFILMTILLKNIYNIWKKYIE